MLCACYINFQINDQINEEIHEVLVLIALSIHVTGDADSPEPSLLANIKLLRPKFRCRYLHVVPRGRLQGSFLHMSSNGSHSGDCDPQSAIHYYPYAINTKVVCASPCIYTTALRFCTSQIPAGNVLITQVIRTVFFQPKVRIANPKAT